MGCPHWSCRPCLLAPTPEHKGFGSGYIDLPQAVHETVVYAVLESLAKQGFQYIMVLTGCGQHHVQGPVDRLNSTYLGRARAYVATLPLHQIWCHAGDPAVPGGHADSFATSVSLFLRPSSVRRALIRDPHHGPVDWQDPNLDFSSISSTGVIGDPTHASAELGARLWAQVIAAGVDELVQFVQEPLPSDPVQGRLGV